jgi:Beta-propeller repeat
MRQENVVSLILQTRATAGRRRTLAAGVAFAFLALVLFFPARGSAQEADPAGDLPLAFAPNAGQMDDSVRYVARGAGYSFFFTDEQAVLSLVKTDGQAAAGVALELRFVGTSPEVRLEAREPAAGTVSQLTGSSGDSASDVETYQELVYRDLWPGIDMVFRGDGGELKYEFHLDPGADPRDIRLNYDGASGLALNSDGDLEIGTPLGVLNDARPVSYQASEGDRMPVDSRYAIHRADGGGYGFDVGDYDRSRPLVIDPAIDFSTFVGGTGSDSGRGIDVDGAGNIYVTGQTASANYPTTLGVFDRGYNNNTDVFVTKLDSSGSMIVYSTFIGGSAFDSGNGIAVDASGAAYVAGFSGSLNYPTTPGSFDTTQNGGSDAFVTKLDPTGSKLEYSTYLGGAGFSFEGANGIAVDSDGSAYVAGFTGSAAFPTTPGAYDTTKNGTGNDVYVTKLDPSGAKLGYSTFLGGTTSDTGNGVAVDGKGRAYLTGFTASADFPATPNAHDSSHNGGSDAFVTRLDSTGSGLEYSTVLGGAGNDSSQGIAVDANGELTSVVGSTSSSDFPSTPRAHDRTYNGNGDAFIATFDKFSRMAYSTFLGGTESDAGSGIAVDQKGKLMHITGSTASANYPTAGLADDPSYNGAGDAFLASLRRSNGELVRSTFLGGIGNDVGNAVAVGDDRKRAYVTGSTSSTEFPSSVGAFDGSFNGAGDVFIASASTSQDDDQQ